MSAEHSFANPSAAGLGALAVACFGFGAVFTGQVQLGGLPLLAAWLIGGGIVQLTVAVIELKDHNLTGGNVFLFFCAFFMFGAALSTLAKFLMLTGMFGDVKPLTMVEGYCWMAGAAFLTVVSPAYLKSAKPMFIAVVLLDIVLWMIVLADMGKLDPTLKPVIGYLLYVAGWIGIYMVAALVNNAAFGRQVVPTFGTWVK
ncbi:MAG: GPR1/FUN34/YaaH family transporter [Desulfobulbaceae bacterium]|jgi:succinate-acetate transporter protein|nr:GPR1/FUN34/YaaH family transporter [Desulfobulbaceae bacterium]